MDTNKFLVDQYLFETEEEYELALSEKKKIQYIDEHADYRAAENVAMLYKKMVDTCMFQTPVGYAYLERLREFLVRSGAKTENLPSIPVKAKLSSEDKAKLLNENVKLQELAEKSKKRSRITLTICVALVIVVIALFAIALTSKHPNIINYENALLNKYSAWEQDLTERENDIKEKELASEIDE